jgi:hypothetical protein
MNEKPTRTEDDLRAAIAMAAQEAPSAADVRARLAVPSAVSSPARPPRRWGTWAPLAAAAVVLLAIGVPIAISQSSSTQKSSSNSASGLAVAGSSGDKAGESNGFSAGSATSGPINPNAPSTGLPSDGPSAGHVCTPTEVSLKLVWATTGASLTGTLTATNISSAACDLLVKPSVTPLGTNGTPLDIQNIASAEAKIGPQQLLPGASTVSTITWNGWCGAAASNQAQVSWGTGTATAAVSGPLNPTCASSNPPRLYTISSTWFDPLS